MNNAYLYDQQFLEQLALQKNKEIYARVFLLDLQENPVETLEGRVSTGSINLSGTSAISRTCNLTFLAQVEELNEYMWSQESKFKLEIGLNNDISALYPKTCWFKQGVYLITGFSASKTTNNCQVSIQGTDKMALLNGICGGVVQASMDFGTIDDKGIIKKVPIKEIIREAVHEYALEPYSNIIINDVDDYGTELVEYYGDKDLFLISKGGGSEEALFQSNKINICFNGKIEYYDSNGEKVENISALADLPDEAFVKMFDVDTPYQNFEIGTIKDTKDDSKQQIFAAKFSGGQRETIGRKKTELTYAGDLIANIGDNIANAVLNKITSQMPSFEYFYNVDGQFVFQQKKRYKTAAKMSDNKEQIKDPLEPSFLFNNAELITNYSIVPDIKNIKNDFAIWSSRKVNNIDVLLYSRYALDTKPISYKSPWPYSSNGIEKQILDLDNFYGDKLKNDGNSILEPFVYFDEKQNDFIQITTKNYDDLPLNTLIYCKYEQIELTSKKYDWREIILRMAQDYKKMHIRDDFLLQIEEVNPQYVGGITGYEQYYNDILKFFNEGPMKYYTRYYNKIDELEKYNFYETINGLIQPYWLNVWQNYYFYLDKNNSSKIKDSKNLIFGYTGFPQLIVYLLEQQKFFHFFQNCFGFIDEKETIDFSIKYKNNVLLSGMINKKTLQFNEDEAENINKFIEEFSKDYNLNNYTFQTGKSSAITGGSDLYFYDLFAYAMQAWKKYYYSNDDNVKPDKIFNKYFKDNGLQQIDFFYYTVNNTDWIESTEYIDINKNEQLKAAAYKTNSIIKYGTNNSPLDLFNINKQEIYINSPENITRWFDFQEPVGELEQFAVKKIGQRLYAKNENNLKVIDYKRIPNIAFVSLAEDKNAFTDEFLGTYSINNIPNIYQNVIGVSDRGISIQEKIDELLNQYTYPIKSLTFKTLPLYWLQPNDIIFINDKDLPAINGKYMISSILIPLTHNETLSISASKIIEE